MSWGFEEAEAADGRRRQQRKSSGLVDACQAGRSALLLNSAMVVALLLLATAVSRPLSDSLGALGGVTGSEALAVLVAAIVMLDAGLLALLLNGATVVASLQLAAAVSRPSFDSVSAFGGAAGSEALAVLAAVMKMVGAGHSALLLNGATVVAFPMLAAVVSRPSFDSVSAIGGAAGSEALAVLVSVMRMAGAGHSALLLNGATAVALLLLSGTICRLSFNGGAAINWRRLWQWRQ